MGISARKIVGQWAPVALALALLIVVRPLAPFDASSPIWAKTYFAEIRDVAAKFPYRVGQWVGTDVDAPPAAIKILKPNVLMQRRFVNPATGQTFSVLLVHCGDTRDMQGHYPPVCYKGQGWGSPTSTRSVTLRFGAARIPATDYEFHRFINGARRSLRVVDFFVLPSAAAPFAADMSALDVASRHSLAAALGSAQVQLIAGDMIRDGERLPLAEEFLDALRPILQAVVAGGRNG